MKSKSLYAVPDPSEVRKIAPRPRKNILLNAYLIPMYDEEMRRRQMKYCADAHIDLLSSVYPARYNFWHKPVHTPEWYKQAMREAAEYGLILQTREIRLQECLEKTDDEILALAHEYKDIPGFGGFYVVDEPINPSLYAHTENLLRSVCPDTLVNVNCHPRGVYGDYYLRQLTDYGSLLTFNGTLSLDVYCFSPGGGVDEQYLFSNYEDLHRAALMTGHDTAVYVQSIGMPHQYGYRRPSPADLRYNMMSALAYGIKEIKFFCWGTPIPEEGGNYTEGIIGSDGLPTDLYEPVCAINAYVHAIGQYIAACDAMAVYHSKQHFDCYQAVPADLFIQPVGDCEIILSLMKARGGKDEYIMLVNKDFTAPQTFTCAVSGVDSLEIVNTEGKLVPLVMTDGRFTLTLDAGDAAVIKLPAGEFIQKPEKSADLARSAMVSATSSVSDGDMYIYNTYDGIKNGDGVSLKSPDGSPQSLTFDLHEVTAVNRVDIAPARTGDACGLNYPDELTIAVSVDGKHWQAVAATKAGDIARPLTTVPVFRFEDVDARYVRVTVTGLPSAICAAELGDISIYHDDGRIPEDEPTLYTPPVYQPADIDLARNKPIAGYSSTMDIPYGTSRHTFINNGNRTYVWSSEYRRNDTPTGTEWIVIDLLATLEVNKIVLVPSRIAANGSNAFPNAYRLEVSTDGVHFTTVVDKTNDNRPVSSDDRVLTFNAIRARYVRFVATELTPLTVSSELGYGVELAELKVYGPGSVTHI